MNLQSSIIRAEVAISKLTHAWDDTELLVQRHVNLRRDDLQRWESFGYTVDSFWSLEFFQKKNIRMSTVLASPKLNTAKGSHNDTESLLLRSG